MRYRKFSTSLATGGRFLGRKKTIGRGAPCGRPSSAILASELRCDCPAIHDATLSILEGGIHANYPESAGHLPPVGSHQTSLPLAGNAFFAYHQRIIAPYLNRGASNHAARIHQLRNPLYEQTHTRL